MIPNPRSFSTTIWSSVYAKRMLGCTLAKKTLRQLMLETDLARIEF